MKYYSAKKPNKCPKCGSPKVVNIVYGEPTFEAYQEEVAEKIILGGYIVTGKDPLWGCTECKTKIHKRKFRAFP